MTEQVMEQEVVKNMEHLIKLLHQEWERSGRTKAEAIMDLKDAGTIKMRLAKAMQERQRLLAGEEMSFKRSMELSRENFILLRLAKKIKEGIESIEGVGKEASVSVELDKEEYKLFSGLIKEEEA